MADIFINLKRFDIPRRMGGICPKDSPGEWIEWVVGESVERGLGKLAGFNIVYLLPEALILDAFRALNRCPAADTEGIRIGSQGVFREDVKPGGNFGAFTTNLPAAAVRNMGCTWSIIGHSEERKDKLGIVEAYDPGLNDSEQGRLKAADAVNRLINREVLCALNAGLNVLLCVGETAEERGQGSFEEQKPKIEAVLAAQLESGLRETSRLRGDLQIVIGYEPIWAIGPGKTPPGAEYIGFVADLIKSVIRKRFDYDPVVVYGGGLKEENAAMIAGIGSIGGGLVALTRFTGEIAFEPEGLQRIIEKYMQQRDT